MSKNSARGGRFKKVAPKKTATPPNLTQFRQGIQIYPTVVHSSQKCADSIYNFFIGAVRIIASYILISKC